MTQFIVYSIGRPQRSYIQVYHSNEAAFWKSLGYYVRQTRFS
jgi:hypothetical protein